MHAIGCLKNWDMKVMLESAVSESERGEGVKGGGGRSFEGWIHS